MEKLKLTKEVKFLPSIKKWCCGIWCWRGEYKHSIWTGGYFHKKREKAEELAMDSFKKTLDFYKECELPTEKYDLSIIHN